MYAKANGLHGFAVSSCGFNLARPKEPMWPGAIYATIEDVNWYEEKNMTFVAWSAQAAGWFAKIAQQDSYSEDLIRVYDSPVNHRRAARAQILAQKYSVTPTQIALAYVIRKSNINMAVVGPETENELHQSFEAFNIPLRKKDIGFLED